jgi:hypothetical protein
MLQMAGVKRNVADEYEILGELGKGSYSVCRLCVHRVTRIEYAAKVRQIISERMEKYYVKAQFEAS